jgi:hypothetical protein
MTRRGFLWLVAAVAGLMAHPDRASIAGGAASHDLPRPSGFVDHDGWIVTPADRDALVGIQGRTRGGAVRTGPVHRPR